MASCLPLHMLFLFAVVSSTKSLIADRNCLFMVTIDPEAGNRDCKRDLGNGDQRQRFKSMECALEAINSSGYNGSQPACIELISGKHVLGYSSKNISYDVAIIGSSSDNVTISCTGNVSKDMDYTEFPLRFTNSTNVTISGVNFSGCARPLLFYGVFSVELEDCEFSEFTQSAVEIYRTPYITVTNCTFTNNTSNGKGTIRASGNAGAMSIGYDETFHDVTKIMISDCNFINNSAHVTECVAVDTILTSKRYTQRGGAVACYFAAGIEVTLRFERCNFTNNIAQDGGGGVYINLSGDIGAVNNITLRNCTFMNNTAVGGGAIQATFDLPRSGMMPSSLTAIDCHFENNTAEFGGGLRALQINSQGNLNKVWVERCMFVKNGHKVGAALHMQSPVFDIYLYPQTESRIVIKDCTFRMNTAKRGVAVIINNHVDFWGNNTFSDNNGTSIRATGSLISLQGGTLTFANNYNEGFSGAVYISSFSQILLYPNNTVYFINNTGSVGASVVAKRISSGFAKTLYNPQCFVQFYKPQVPPMKWEDYNVSMVFTGNRALAGPVLFITDLDSCSWYNNSGKFFNSNITDTWTFVNATYVNTVMNNYVIRDGHPLDKPELYIQTEMQKLSIADPPPKLLCTEERKGEELEVCAYPGQKITLNATALDQFQNPTTGYLHIAGNESFTPSVVRTSSDEDEVSFEYSSSSNYDRTEVTMEASFSATEVRRQFTLVHLECPPGFKLSSDSDPVCKCEDRGEVLTCDPDMEFVLLDDGLWGAPPSWSRTLVTHPCPPGYCNCSGSPNEDSSEGCALIYDRLDGLCDHKRSGILCGECNSPYGVGMLSTMCRSFKAEFSMYYWLMPLLGIFIVATVIVIVKVGVSLPSHLLGFLFYIQVAPAAVRYLSAFLELKPDIMQFIASFLALYVPYDFSLHERLTALESYGLRYISPLLVIVIIPFIIKIRYRAESWRGVWTLLLLMYAMTIETSSSLLFCPTLTSHSNGTSESITVWFFDGSVRCWTGVHLFLALLSLLFLILGALLIPAVALIVYQPELSKKFSFLDHGHFEKLSHGFTHPYREIHRWWAPLELIRRYVFIMAVIFTPGYQTVSLSIAGGILVVQWFVQPYRDWKANLSEAFSLLVLVIILCLGDTNNLVVTAAGTENFTLWPLFYLPLVVGIMCLCATVGLTIWKLLKTRWNTYHEKVEKADDQTHLSRKRSTLTRPFKWSLRATKQVVSIDEDDEDVEL